MSNVLSVLSIKQIIPVMDVEIGSAINIYLDIQIVRKDDNG